jgi:LPS O-antigen subunit length determinant protein (WzzB/FepE family)
MSTTDGEISVKYVVLKLKEWIRYLWSKWLIIGIAALVCGVLTMLYTWFSRPSYTATLSFVLSSSAQTSSLAGLASQFGIDLSGGSDDAFTGGNIMALMNSKTMVQKALLQKPEGSNELLVNMLAKDEKMDKGWNNLPRTKGAYPFPDDASKFTGVQDSLFRNIYKEVAENYLNITKPDDNESVYVVETTSHDELFSLYLTKYLVDATSKFYIDTKTSVAKTNLAMIQHEADSLRRLLTGSISSTSQIYDQTYNLNPAYQSQRNGAQEGQLTITAVGTAYGEVLKNLELAKITLLKETPLYQVIDEPQLPLVADKRGRLFSLIVGGFIGVVLMSAFLITKRSFS